MTIFKKSLLVAVFAGMGLSFATQAKSVETPVLPSKPSPASTTPSVSLEQLRLLLVLPVLIASFAFDCSAVACAGAAGYKIGNALLYSAIGTSVPSIGAGVIPPVVAIASGFGCFKLLQAHWEYKAARKDPWPTLPPVPSVFTGTILALCAAGIWGVGTIIADRGAYAVEYVLQ